MSFSLTGAATDLVAALVLFVGFAIVRFGAPAIRPGGRSFFVSMVAATLVLVALFCVWCGQSEEDAFALRMVNVGNFAVSVGDGGGGTDAADASDASDAGDSGLTCTSITTLSQATTCTFDYDFSANDPHNDNVWTLINGVSFAGSYSQYGQTSCLSPTTNLVSYLGVDGGLELLANNADASCFNTLSYDGGPIQYERHATAALAWKTFTVQAPYTLSFKVQTGTMDQGWRNNTQWVIGAGCQSGSWIPASMPAALAPLAGQVLPSLDGGPFFLCGWDGLGSSEVDWSESYGYDGIQQNAGYHTGGASDGVGNIDIPYSVPGLGSGYIIYSVEYSVSTTCIYTDDLDGTGPHNRFCKTPSSAPGVLDGGIWQPNEPQFFWEDIEILPTLDGGYEPLPSAFYDFVQRVWVTTPNNPAAFVPPTHA